jgi:hypothetical protein
MPQIKITFTKENIDKDVAESVELSVKEASYDGKEITKIFFTPLSGDPKNVKSKDELITKLKGSEKFELTFDDEKVSIKVIVSDNTATAATNDQKPAFTFNETNKRLRIQWDPVIFEIEEVKSTSTSKEELINKSIQEIKDKFQELNIDSDKETEILEEDWESNYRAGWDELNKTEIEDAKNEAIGKISNYSSNEIVDKDAVEEITCQKKVEGIDKTLESEDVKAEDLEGEAKTSYDKLKGNEFTSESDINDAEKKVNDGIYKNSAKRKFDDLTTRINKAIEDENEEDMKNLDTELNNFINNSNYQSRKTDAEALSKKLKNGISKNGTNGISGWFSQNWKVATPIILTAILVIVGAVVYFRRNNNTEIE